MSSVQSVPAFQISPASGGHGLSLSDSAARRLAKLAADEGRPVLLRVAVDGGGCSGFQYRFELVETAEPDDLRIETAGQTALVDGDAQQDRAALGLSQLREAGGGAVGQAEAMAAGVGRNLEGRG